MSLRSVFGGGYRQRVAGVLEQMLMRTLIAAAEHRAPVVEGRRLQLRELSGPELAFSLGRRRLVATVIVEVREDTSPKAAGR